MHLKLRTITERADANTLLPLLTRAANETRSAHDEDAEPRDDLGTRYLEVNFDASESIVVVAVPSESDDPSASPATKPMAVAATAPHVDPLTGDVEPLLVMLYVDPSIRHRGVARALVAELRRRLGERGHAVLTARADHNDDAVISMGERWGLVRAWELMSTRG